MGAANDMTAELALKEIGKPSTVEKNQTLARSLIILD